MNRATTPLMLSSHLDKKGIEMLVSAIHKPRGINVPLWLQEIIAVVCFCTKHHGHCGDAKFHPSLITLDSLEELQLQQGIKEAHNN